MNACKLSCSQYGYVTHKKVHFIEEWWKFNSEKTLEKSAISLSF